MAKLDFYRASILVQKAQAAPLHALMVRLAIVTALLLFCLIVFWFGRAGLKDQIDGSVSTLDVLYFSVVTISTTGYGDIIPASDAMKLFAVFVLTPVRLIVWFILIGTAYEFVVQRLIEVYRMSRIAAQLNNHVIVCGAGQTGKTAIQELLTRGHAANSIVVIDKDEAICRAAAEQGCIALHGDGSSEALLLDAAVERAQCVVACAGRDDSNLLITLTVRNLNPGIRIIANVHEEENLKLLKQAGASIVVRPAQLVGHLLAGAVGGNYLADTALDLLDAQGPLRPVERVARADEVGRGLAEVVEGFCLRVYRGTRAIHRWDVAARIEAGDLLHVIETGK